MIGFIGLSHLGIVYSLATAAKGFEVFGFDPDAQRCDELNAGTFPVAEPGLEELFHTNRSRIRFNANPAGLSKCALVFVSLDVPTDDAGRSDLDPLTTLIEQSAGQLSPETPLVVLCQVPPGFTRSLKASFARRSIRPGAALFYQVETLVFGNAVERALRPERYIIGCEDPPAPVPDAYAQWLTAFDCPVLAMRYESAELAKIAINLFLVSTVTTTNTLAELCERTGADWSEIAPALRLDKRIGPHAYLSPGLGIAGGNLERDLVTVQQVAAASGVEASIVAAWQLDSGYRRDWALRKIHELVLAGKQNPVIAIWGLAYKPNTHSTKNSPALALLEALAPFTRVAFDPQVKFGPAKDSRLRLAASALEACAGADGLVVMTPWAEFSRIEPANIKAVMAGKVIIDPFGALDAAACAQCGFAYHRLGAPGGLGIENYD